MVPKDVIELGTDEDESCGSSDGEHAPPPLAQRLGLSGAEFSSRQSSSMRHGKRRRSTSPKVEVHISESSSEGSDCEYIPPEAHTSSSSSRSAFSASALCRKNCVVSPNVTYRQQRLALNMLRPMRPPRGMGKLSAWRDSEGASAFATKHTCDLCQVDIGPYSVFHSLS